MRGLLADHEIRQLVKEMEMISPFLPEQVRELDGKKIISAGVSSYGYDMRCADEFKIFVNRGTGGIVDPKGFDPSLFLEERGKGYCLIPPGSFALTRSVEKFKMPRNVTGICLGKSTYARCGIVVGITPLEAGWEGYLTIEVSNTTPLPAKIYGGEGIAQCLFFWGEQAPFVAYDQRAGGGKYQNQGPEPVAAKV